MVHRHFLLHKPFGYLSQFKTNANKERNKNFLGDLHDFPEGIMAIGRLDEQSEGLILLTTDGKVSEQVRSKIVEKEYLAQVDGLIKDNDINILCKGVEIGIRGEKYMTLPCQVRLLSKEPDFAPRIKKIRDSRHGPTSWISIILTEGKYRQVRKMTSAVGFPTLRLIRIRVGSNQLNNLPPGNVIEVNNLLQDSITL